MLNKNENKGNAKRITAPLKEKVGEVTNDSDRAAKGEAKQVKGKPQEKVDEGQRKGGEAKAKTDKAQAAKR